MTTPQERHKWQVRHDIVIDQNGHQLYLSSTGKPDICGAGLKRQGELHVVCRCC